MLCAFGKVEQEPSFCCPKSLASPLLCPESHPSLLVHPWSASSLLPHFAWLRLLSLQSFCEDPRYLPLTFLVVHGLLIFSAAPFPYKSAPRSVCLSPGEAAIAPASGKAPSALQLHTRPAAASLSVPSGSRPPTCQGQVGAREYPCGVLRPSLYTLQATPGKFKQRCSVSLLC